MFKSSSQERNCKLGVENFLKHFRYLGVSKDNGCIDFLNTECDMKAVFTELDVPISEVEDVINGLKCKKSPRKDKMINEYFKNVCDNLSPLLTRMFNVIFEAGIFPPTWCDCVVVLIFKKVIQTIQIIIQESLSCIAC